VTEKRLHLDEKTGEKEVEEDVSISDVSRGAKILAEKRGRGGLATLSQTKG